MCAYTHIDGLHVQRWNTAEAVEPAYEPEEVAEVLAFAEIIASLSVIGVVNLAQDEELANSVFQRFKSPTLHETNYSLASANGKPFNLGH